MSEVFITIFSAMIPIGELRFAIPFALSNFDLDWPVVLFCAVLGNILPVPIIIFSLKIVGNRVEHMDNYLGMLFRWRTNKLLTKLSTHQKYPLLGIFLLVAVPLPFTGAWTGSLAVWLSGISYTRGIASITLGVVTAGLIVTALYLTGSKFLF